MFHVQVIVDGQVVANPGSSTPIGPAGVTAVPWQIVIRPAAVGPGVDVIVQGPANGTRSPLVAEGDSLPMYYVGTAQITLVGNDTISAGYSGPRSGDTAYWPGDDNWTPTGPQANCRTEVGKMLQSWARWSQGGVGLSKARPRQSKLAEVRQFVPQPYFALRARRGRRR